MSSQNVPITNKASESEFAILDLLIRNKPNASVQAIQALTMWARNGTSEWLNNLSAEKRSEIVDSARSNVMAMKAKYKSRQLKLTEQRHQKLLRKQNLKQQVEAKSNEKKIEAVNNLQELNVRAWITVDEAEQRVLEISELKRGAVILAQIEFYRYVMLVKCPLKFYTKTKVVDNKRVPKDWKELLENLKVMIKTNLMPEHKVVSTSLKSREDRLDVVFANKKELMNKIKDARLKRICDQQKKDILPKYLSNPALLEGKQIQHKVVEQDDSDVFWERGVVLKVVRNNVNTKKTEYEVRYDSEPEAVWKFPLLIDLEKGDLLVL